MRMEKKKVLDRNVWREPGLTEDCSARKEEDYVGNIENTIV
jgi:hypothetical protein